MEGREGHREDVAMLTPLRASESPHSNRGGEPPVLSGAEETGNLAGDS